MTPDQRHRLEELFLDYGTTKYTQGAVDDVRRKAQTLKLIRRLTDEFMELLTEIQEEGEDGED